MPRILCDLLHPHRAFGLWLVVFVSGLCVPAVATPPAAPTLDNVYATIPTSATDTANKVPITCNYYLLYWTDNATDEDFYLVEVRVPGTYNSWAPIYMAKNSTSAYFTGLNFEGTPTTPTVPQGASIEWRVSACKGTTTPTVTISERSDYSTVKAVTYDRNPEAGFSAATNFVVTMTPNSDGSLHFTWTDNSDKEEGYELFLRDTSGSYGTSAVYNFDFGATAPEVAAPLQPGKSYTMKIRPYRATAYTVNSQNVAVPTAYDYGAFSNESTVVFAQMKAPTALAATTVDEDSIKLTWADNSSNETHYLVQYRTPSGSGSWQDLGTVAGNSTTVTFDWIPSLDTEWRVLADYEYTDQNNAAARVLSAPSNTVVHVLEFKAPTNLQVTIAGDHATNNCTATLTWTDNSSVETGYIVLLKETSASGAFSVVKTVSTPNTTSTTFTAALTPGVSYDWQVQAIDVISSSTYGSGTSNTVAAKAKDRITSRLYQPAAVGTAFSFTLTTTTGAAPAAFSATNLPDGLGINASTGEISGTPTKAGLFATTVSATFSDGFTDTKSMPFRVAAAPTGPTKPVVLSSRSVGTGASVEIPLSTGVSDTSLFEDTDAAQAVKVSTALGDFHIILQTALTPQTVANFLSYVNAGDYNGVAFHRAINNFVVQAGGFRPTSTSSTSFQAVTARPSPPNEPGLSNVVGTVAMAKVGGNPNSATHDFFINLANNNGPYLPGQPDDAQSLDNQNGGFTVFGRIAGNGMNVVNQIVGLPQGSYTIDLEDGAGGSTSSGPYQNWPMNTTSAPGSMDNALVLKMDSVTTVPVLSYAVSSNSNPTALGATIANGKLVLNGLADGDSDLVVTATDLDGNAATQSFTVHVVAGYAAPAISTHPAGTTKIEAESVTFNVTATGTNLAYQWKKNGQNLSGQTGASLQLTNLHASDAGDYSVLVTNDAGFALSNPAHLTVQVPVSITTPPAPLQTVNYGSSVTFTVVAAGDPTITYQWRKGTTNINGETSPSYTINNVKLTDAGSYNVVVTNPVNPPNNSVISSDAELVVLPIDTDGDGLTDDQELVKVTGNTNPDTDGDGYVDGLEVGAGTDPKLAASKPGSGTFYAQKDGAPLLATLPMKRLLGAVVPDALAGGTSTATVPDFWLGTTELTNAQFASILQRAKQDNLISVATEGGRRVVRFPKTGGEIVCYLATPAPALPSDPPSCGVDLDSIGSSFTVASATVDFPAHAVSWHGAYLCSLVLNNVNGYAAKNLTATWSYNNGADGYHLPSYQEWELAGRGISPTFAQPGLAYPTGTGVTSASQAWFNQTAASAAPKKTKSYAASRLGLFDLAGNVAEWVTEGADINHAYTRGGGFADAATMLINTANASLLRTAVSKEVGVRMALRASGQAGISSQPASKFQRTDAPLTLSVSASGPPPLSYQWYKNNVALPGKTAPSFTIDHPTLADAGSYTVKVMVNGVNAVTSNPALVALVQAVNPAPVITIAALKNTTLKASVAGAAGQTFAYQWKNTGGNITPDLNFSNPTSATMLLNSMLPTHTGAYTCTVSLNGQTALPSVDTGFGLVVLQNPVITSVTFPASLVVSRSITVPVVVDSDPTRKPASFTITGLPPGLTYNKLTGVISGKPTKFGIYNVSITATNAYGNSNTVKQPIIVNGLDARAYGTFVGLIARNASPTLNNNLGGRLDLTVQSTGAFTAKLNLGGTLYSMTGVLDAKDPSLADHDPTATVTLARTGKPSLRLSLKIGLSTLLLTSSVVEEIPSAGGAATATAAITGWRVMWSAALKADGYDGNFNLSFTPPADNPASTPQGIGYAIVTVPATTGSTTFSGKLPDGTGISSSSYVGPNGEMMHYQPLAAGAGTFTGLMRTAIHTRTVSATNGAVTWLRKPVAGRNYAAGFDAAMTVGGRSYAPPGTGVIVADLVAAGAANYPNNARVTFTSGGLSLPNPLPPNSTATSLTEHFTITTTNVVQIPAITDLINNPKAVTFAVNKTTGAISGTFTLTDLDTTVTPNKPLSRKVNWYGLIIPGVSPAKAKGLGFFTLPKMPNSAPSPHTISTSDILSGNVTFDGVPVPP